MLLELLVAFFLGIIIGAIAGLLPGIHTNLLTSSLVAFSAFSFLSNFNPLIIAVFIASLAISNVFFEFIPSIYLGACNEDNALAVMPGHKLLMQGKAQKAIYLSLIGCLIGIFLALIFSPLIIIFLPKIYPIMQRMMAWLLLWTSIFLISTDKSKTLALIVFLLAGFLGIATLNLPIQQPLLPLLTGLFGSSSLIYSFSQKVKIPKQEFQEFKKLKIKKAVFKKPFLSSIFAVFCAFMPGLGTSQAAIISSSMFKKISREQFLILLGSISSLVMALSFVVLYVLQKSRTGAAAAIQQLVPAFPMQSLVYILIACFFSALISFFIAIKISVFFSDLVEKGNYSLISIVILIFLVFVVICFSGILGFVVFVVSTFVGLFCIFINVRRGHLMGSLLLPTLLFYMPFF